MKPITRAVRYILAGLLVLLLAGLVIGTIYVVSANNRNAARPEAVAAMQSDELVAVSEPANEDWIVFSPTGQTPTTGFIIYPGGFVDPIAYAPVARAIAAAGYLTVIDPMPLNLAVLGIQGADDIIDSFPNITSWSIGGHSLGGAMAAEYTYRNPGAVDGLALWAAFPAANSDLSTFDIQAVSIYGDADGVASPQDVVDGANRLPADTVFVLIPGGNHTQFGHYGEGLQQGDNPATIDRAEQQQIVVDATTDMLSMTDLSN